MYYVQAGNRTELDVSVINTEKGRNTQFSVSLQERGLYTLSLTLRSSGGSPPPSFPSPSSRTESFWIRSPSPVKRPSGKP